MPVSGERRPLLILGLGNVLCGDDGLGIAALAELERRYRVPEGVELMDGGTLGLALLHHLLAAEEVILVDAVRADAPPGRLVRLHGEEVAPAVESRLSVHQVGVADLMDGLRWLGCGPTRMTLLGMVPETIELGLGRSPAVRRALPELVEAIADEARALGHPLTPRAADEVDDDGRAAVSSRALGL